MDGLTQVVGTRATDRFYINWWLMNHCAWACSYCNDIIRKGNIDLPYLNDCKQFVTDAVFFAASQHKTPRIEFTGGEVTEWTDFLELLTHAHLQGCSTQFRTNANVGLNQWHSYLAVVDDVLIEYHPEYTSSAHFLLAVKAAVDSGVSITVNLNMLKDTWQDSQAVYDKIQSKWPHIRLNKRMLFNDPVFNTSPQKYTQEQTVQLKRQHGDIKILTDSDVEYTDYQTLVLEGRNKFEGYTCWAGVEQVVVDAWGRVYRGHCRQNGFMGNIKDKNIAWSSEPKTCALEACRNSFDILATKSIQLSKI